MSVASRTNVIGSYAARRSDTRHAEFTITRRGGATVSGGAASCSVEVPGIEPGSFSVLPGLLRAQLARSLLGPTAHASKSVRRAQSRLISPHNPRDEV